jgi:hypothetical protein
MTKRKTIGILLILTAMTIVGCKMTPNHPGEEQVKAILAGRYCANDFRHSLEIGHDGRYAGHRSRMSPFGTSMVPEKCEGNYKLTYDNEKNEWQLVFETSDKNSNPLLRCKGTTITIWNEEKGYLVGDSIVTLSDPIDGVPVSSKCDL